MATIILTGGGTAGHVTPHLAILPYLKKDFDKIYYIGSENGIEKEIVERAGIKFYSTPCVKLIRKFTLKNLRIPFTLINGVRKAEKLIDLLKPDVIFSKGGYVALPTVIAASKKRVPVIAHESDLTVGLSNRITAKYCKKVLTSFPDTANTLKNGEFVGAPIRRSLFAVKKSDAVNYFNFKKEKPILLVTGGSSGAKFINEVLRNSLEYLLKTFNVIHICGKGNLSDFEFGEGYYQTEYMNNVEYAFRAADICVTRAGSNTLFELLSLKLPCVVIPLPKTVSRGDQLKNADYFKKLGLVSVIEQENLTENSLKKEIASVYAHKDRIAENFKSHPINDASQKIADTIAAEILNR